MKKILYTLIILLFIISLFSCNKPIENMEYELPSNTESQSTEANDTENTENNDTFKRIVIGFSSVELPVSPYEENGIIYADLNNFVKYFNGTVSFNEEKTIAIVSISDTEAKYQFITFELERDKISATNITTTQTETLSLTTPLKATDNGFDISVTDFATIMGYSYEMNGGVLYIHE